ncbi:MAG: GDSL-type esterase/lipase family protein [Candidatus Gastranaerophilales bacterium]|nr:GDSL-type esterase/lipase family protein [Candidatus Gastranaerophilales bacterium]
MDIIQFGMELDLSKYYYGFMKNILCFGDGNTYGFNPETGGRYNLNERWTGVLQELLRDNYNVIEDAHNARTVIFKDFADIKTCGVDYLPYCLNKYPNVDMIIILLGTNDFQTLFRASVEAVLDGIRTIIDFIRTSENHKNTEILLLAPPYIDEKVQGCKFGCMFNERSVEKSKDFATELGLFAKKLNCNFFDLNKIVQVCSEDCVHVKSFEHRKIGETLAQLIPQLLV